MAQLGAGCPSQPAEPWFDASGFRGLDRLCCIDCTSPTHDAEGFFGHELVLGGRWPQVVGIGQEDGNACGSRPAPSLPSATRT